MKRPWVNKTFSCARLSLMIQLFFIANTGTAR
jgi:hypothetical protein